MTKHTLGAAVAAALFCAACTVWAQEQDTQTVVVRGERNSNDDFESARASVTRDKADILDETPTSVADALRHSPSVSVQETTPGQGSIYVRGLSGREVVHVVDGVRLNAAIFRAGNNPYVGVVDINAMERIEIVPGAASVVYGSDALGGAVLMHTRLPSYRLGDALPVVRAYQSLSSNPVGGVSRFSAEYAEAAWAAHVGATYWTMAPVRPGGGQLTPIPDSYDGLERAPGQPYRPQTSEAQRGTEYSFVGGDLVARRKVLRRTEVVTRAQIGIRPELERYDQITPRFKNDYPDRAESKLAPLMRIMASADGIYRPSAQETVRVGIAWQRLSEDVVSRRLIEQCIVGGTLFDPGEASCPGTLRLVREEERTSESNRSDAVSISTDFTSVKADRRIRVGLFGVHDRVSSSSGVTEMTSGVTRAAPERFPDGSWLGEVAAFGQADVEVVPDVVVYGGVRPSLFRLEVAPRTVTAGEPSPAFEKTFLDVSAGTGIRWEPASGVAWVMNAGRAVRVPNVQDFATLGARAGGRFQIPNAEVDPEHSYSLDTGIKLSIARHRLQTSLFFLRYADAIVIAPTRVNGMSTSPGGDEYVHSVNAAEVDYWGIETAGELAIADRVALFGRALAMLGVQRNNPDTGLPAETPADRVPPHQVDAGIRYAPVSNVTLEVFASGRATQDRLNDPVNIDDNRIPPGGTPGYITYHARGLWSMNDALIARLALDNITDELVLEHGSGFYRAGFSATASLQATLR